MSAYGAMGAHQSAAMASDVWLTPPFILDALGPFDLDPCAAVAQPWATAKRMLTVEDDGLAHEWDGRVWLNPPYGLVAARWLDRLARHHPDGTRAKANSGAPSVLVSYGEEDAWRLAHCRLAGSWFPVNTECAA
jgi:hypothetical protein